MTAHVETPGAKRARGPRRLAIRRPAILAAITGTGTADGSLLFEILSVAGSLAVIWIAVTLGLAHERAVTETNALQVTSNLARSLQESTQRVIAEIDNSLLNARAIREAEGANFSLPSWVARQTAPDRLRAQVSMSDRDGNVIDSTLAAFHNVNVADRTHFTAQRDSKQDNLFISHPVLGRVSQKETIQFSRKLFGPGGAFDGIIVSSLGCDELSRAYQTYELHDGFVSLIATDGTTLARGPVIVTQVERNIGTNGWLAPVVASRVGSLKLRSPDHRLMFVSFRRLDHYPVIVTVAFDGNSYLRDYFRLRDRIIAMSVLLSAAIGMIGVWWIDEKQRGRASNRALRITLDTMDQGILMLDHLGKIPVINSRALELLGFSTGTGEALPFAVAERATGLVAANRNGRQGHGLQDTRATRVEIDFETVNQHGRIIEVRGRGLPGGGNVYIYSDITERRMADRRVRYVAYHDGLTGLANRMQLNERVAELLAAMTAERRVLALLLLDLDGFKAINDTLGHKAGDELLVEVAQRLKSIVRDTDIVARLGGDEFVIVATGLHDAAEIVPLAQRVLNELSRPQRINDQITQLGGSIGIAAYPCDGHDVESLCKNADIALYSAKSEGRGTFRFFDPKLARTASERRELESDLRRALERETLEVYFQPKFGCMSLDIVGFEALLRWKHPTRGFVSPVVFVKIAEECGLIRPLGRWVLQHACATATTWDRPYPVSVNVSVSQLRDRGMRDEVALILQQTGLSPELLELEVTESVMADDDPTVLENLEALKAMAISISMDDFGTGYSSLSYLRRFPFDKIKIDKSFVQSQTSDEGVRVILDAIVGMCRSLGLVTVAEGVETPRQLAMLKARGCSHVQGFLLARPMPEAAVPDFLGGNRPDEIVANYSGAMDENAALQRAAAD